MKFQEDKKEWDRTYIFFMHLFGVTQEENAVHVNVLFYYTSTCFGYKEVTIISRHFRISYILRCFGNIDEQE
jgi:hypothetical protein